MTEAQTATVKYVYLDIVSFTKNRSVEAQSDLIFHLNRIVKEAHDQLTYYEGYPIYLPSGDGVCIALVGGAIHPYDVHLQLALNILRSIKQYNENTVEEMRRFQVRIGINENVDSLVTDINGKTNVAGLGINMSERIMNCADGGQILVSQIVYEQLRAREEYISSFRHFDATGKHGIQFPVYQYIKSNVEGLNSNFPSLFTQATPRLTRHSAYYLAHAIRNKGFFITKRDDVNLRYAGVILLHFLAQDSQETEKRSPYSSVGPKTWGSQNATIDVQYTYYADSDFAVNQELCELLIDTYLGRFSECFELVDFTTHYVFVSSKGIERLKQEHPDIWSEFSLDSHP